MHPAFSVIAFTTLSGAGYGLLAVLGLVRALALAAPSNRAQLLLLALGLVLVTAGLLSSLLHLGRPERAWRALGQWRSSWLSREGVLALATYVPALVLAALLWRDAGGAVPRIAGAALALLALATVLCTAMIYASLKPIPAWRDARVPLVYLGYALAGGLALWLAGAAAAGQPPGTTPAALVAVLAALLLGLKWSYWRAIDQRHAAPAASALGLPADSRVRVFEAPHTEASFVTREMVFVLARRHARALRALALLGGLALPLALAIAAGLVPGAAGPLLGGAALALVAGSLVERWLFFAEARHLVSSYYGR